MTPEAIVTALLRELEAVMAMGGLGKQAGHAPGCQRGIWTSAAVIPDGAPCSKRCQAAQQAIRAAQQWLESNRKEAEQMALEASA